MRRFQRVLQGLLVILATILLAPFYFVMTGGLRRNQARRALRPVLARLSPLHPHTLARGGDNGYSVANTTPWYTVYLSVDSRPDLEATLVAAARAAGYDLSSVPAVNPSGWHLVNETSSCLVASVDGRKLSVTITRGGQIRLYAHDRRITWAQPATPEPGRAILDVHVSLPRIDRSRAKVTRAQQPA